MQFPSQIIAAAFLTLANSAALASRSLSGEATFYGGNLAGGTCSFSTYTLPSGIYGTALSSDNWDNAGNCGACVSVTGPSGNTTTAMVVDMCPNCGENHLDLFPDAFAALAAPTTGLIDTTWTYVDCPITSPLQVHNKDGVSAYWFSMQVVNAKKVVSTLEVSTDDGSTWQSTTRQSYNFFENSSGFGTTTVDVKVTSVDGDVVVVKNVTVNSGTSVTASSNFGSFSFPATAAVVAASPPSSATPVAQETSTSVPEMAPQTTFTTPVSSSTSFPGANFAETSAEPSVSITASPSAQPTTISSFTTTVTSTKTKKCTSVYPTSTLASPTSAEFAASAPTTSVLLTSSTSTVVKPSNSSALSSSLTSLAAAAFTAGASQAAAGFGSMALCGLAVLAII